MFRYVALFFETARRRGELRRFAPDVNAYKRCKFLALRTTPLPMILLKSLQPKRNILSSYRLWGLRLLLRFKALLRSAPAQIAL